MGQIIKQSTNILAQNVEKRYDDQRHEMMVNINEVFEREVSKMRQQNLNNIFDTWNYLSEIKVSLKDILTSLTIQTRQSSENLKTKVGNCQELVLQFQQKMEKKSSLPKQKLKSIQYLLPTEDSSELEVECSQSNLVDEFHTILYSETDMSDSMNNGQSGDFKTSSKDEFHTPMSEFETSSLNVGQTSQSLSFSNKIEFEPILEEMPEKSLNNTVEILQNYQSTNTANISHEIMSEFDTELKKNIKINECHKRKALVSLKKFSKSDVEKMIGYRFSRQARKKIATKRFQHTALPKKSNFIKTTSMKNECLPDETDFDEDEFQGGFRRRKAIEKTRNLLRSRSTLLRTINFPGIKRKLLDEEEMFRILIETRQDLSQIDHALGRSNNSNIPAQEPCFLPSTTKREPVKTGYETPDYSCNQTFLSAISTVY